MTETEIIMNKKYKTLSQWFLNPFYYIAGVKALVIGVVVIAITGCLAFLKTCRFDGLLNFYIRPLKSPLWICIAEGFVSWLLFSILILIAGKIISKSRFRIIDLFGTQALARFPYLFLASAVMIPGLIPAFIRFNNILLSGNGVSQLFSLDLIAFAFLLIILFTAAIWMVALMYKAFIVSCNVSGKKAVIAFIICLLIGQFISIIVISHFPRPAQSQITVTIQPLDLSSKSNKFITLLSWGEYNAAENMFDETMKSAVPEEKLKEVWESILNQYGPYKSPGALRKDRIQIYDVIYVTLQFEKNSLDSQISFDSNGKIAGLYFLPAASK
jgi:hypothetical protein